MESANAGTNGTPNVTQERKPRKEKGSKRNKEDKSLEAVMKSLSQLPAAQEKLDGLSAKYAELFEEFKQQQLAARHADKKLLMVQREKEQVEGEQAKAVMSRTRLELLCRELQKQNKTMKEESLLRIREEEEKRKEVSAKFQATLSEITALMQQNSESNNKLRDENLSIQKQFKGVCEQYELREQQVDKMAHQIKLETQLSEAKLAKAKLELQAQKEVLERDKAQLMAEVAMCQAKCVDHQKTEAALRAQINVYFEKYDEFQNILTKSNQVYAKFKTEMEKMSKKITRLEKETASWKQKWERTHKELLSQAAEKQLKEGELVQQGRQLSQLQKLCRTMQAERSALLHQLTAAGLTPAKGIEAKADIVGLTKENSPTRPSSGGDGKPGELQQNAIASTDTKPSQTSTPNKGAAAKSSEKKKTNNKSADNSHPSLDTTPTVIDSQMTTELPQVNNGNTKEVSPTSDDVPDSPVEILAANESLGENACEFSLADLEESIKAVEVAFNFEVLESVSSESLPKLIPSETVLPSVNTADQVVPSFSDCSLQFKTDQVPSDISCSNKVAITSEKNSKVADEHTEHNNYDGSSVMVTQNEEVPQALVEKTKDPKTTEAIKDGGKEGRNCIKTSEKMSSNKIAEKKTANMEPVLLTDAVVVKEEHLPDAKLETAQVTSNNMPLDAVTSVSGEKAVTSMPARETPSAAYAATALLDGAMTSPAPGKDTKTEPSVLANVVSSTPSASSDTKTVTPIDETVLSPLASAESGTSSASSDKTTDKPIADVTVLPLPASAGSGTPSASSDTKTVAPRTDGAVLSPPASAESGTPSASSDTKTVTPIDGTVLSPFASAGSGTPSASSDAKTVTPIDGTVLSPPASAGSGTPSASSDTKTVSPRTDGAVLSPPASAGSGTPSATSDTTTVTPSTDETVVTPPAGARSVTPSASSAPVTPSASVAPTATTSSPAQPQPKKRDRRNRKK